jgi:hypothetical protein
LARKRRRQPTFGGWEACFEPGEAADGRNSPAANGVRRKLARRPGAGTPLAGTPLRARRWHVTDESLASVVAGATAKTAPAISQIHAESHPPRHSLATRVATPQAYPRLLWCGVANYTKQHGGTRGHMLPNVATGQRRDSEGSERPQLTRSLRNFYPDVKCSAPDDYPACWKPGTCRQQPGCAPSNDPPAFSRQA